MAGWNVGDITPSDIVIMRLKEVASKIRDGVVNLPSSFRGCSDPLSLYMSLKDSPDERIKKAIADLLEKTLLREESSVDC